MTHPLTIRTADDLRAAWRFIDGGHGYSAPQTFALIIESDGSVLPSIIQIYDDDLDPAERDEMVGRLIATLRSTFVIDNPGSTIAILRARPGRRTMTADDGEWCRAFHRQLVRAGLDTFPIYFATDESIGPVPPDALIAVA